eukprot:4915086-Ditylum_brightwellii.AAC.1
MGRQSSKKSGNKNKKSRHCPPSSGSYVICRKSPSNFKRGRVLLSHGGAQKQSDIRAPTPNQGPQGEDKQ